MPRFRFHVFALALSATAAALTIRLLASTASTGVELDQHAADPAHTTSAETSALVDRIRRATDGFRDTIPREYSQFLGCVSGPEEGAMGVHFVDFSSVDDKLELEHPEALIYELKNGRARLVGVEYIVPAELWDASHTAPPDPPVLEGQLLLQFTESPNRFRLPAFYELHVWAWRDNPKGTFVDWNPNVSCDGQ
jgi:hypothetical protein